MKGDNKPPPVPPHLLPAPCGSAGPPEQNARAIAVAAIRQAAQGLTYPSESDYPFELVDWQTDTTDVAKALGDFTKAKSIEPVAIDAFFAELADHPQAARFDQLRKVLQAQLAELQVFRVHDDRPRIGVYLLGTPPTGGLAGLKTLSIET